MESCFSKPVQQDHLVDCVHLLSGRPFLFWLVAAQIYFDTLYKLNQCTILHRSADAYILILQARFQLIKNEP